MNQKTDSPTPTPEQLEALKQAAAFAYGRSLCMLGATGLEKYRVVVHRLEHDLREFGCFNTDGLALKEEYFSFQLNGAFHCAEELEKLGI